MSSPDNDLSFLLQEWSARVEPGAGFQRAVWSRIASTEQGSPQGLAALLSWLTLLASPRIATATVALALFGGIMIGGLQARSAAEERYLLSLKPSVAATMTGR
jgi:hypothetical protein